MYEFENHIDLINHEYLKRVKHNPHYSKRAFSKLLGVSAGALSEILSGKRNLSQKIAVKIGKNLSYTDEEVDFFIGLLHKREEQKKSKLKTLEIDDLDTFYMISEWYCTAILNLVYLKDFCWEISWIAKRLNITKVEVENALQKLESLGFIEKNAQGYDLTQGEFQTRSDIPSQAIKNFHSTMLEKAKKSLLFQTVEQREISGISFNINLEDLSKIKKEMDKFQNYLANKYNSNPSDEVYHLETCFFRLTEKI